MGDEHDGRAEFPLQIAQQVQDLRLDGDVQRRGGFVGDDEVRFAEQRHGDHHPLAQSATELVRILAQALAGVADADLFQHGLRACPGGLAIQPAVAPQHLGELVADAVGRIEGGHGFLEYHRQAIAAQVAHALFAQGQEVVLAQRQARRLAPGLARQQIHQRQGGERLAAAGLAHQAEHFAPLHLQVQAAHGVQGVIPQGDIDAQVSYVEQCHGQSSA
ncbi:hypothetical protein BGI51_18175 [Pseudomonas oryzihabitans]|nr:hypothetical protein BGI51_18175 [Pseudomonas psychrotolerans]